MTGAGFPVVSVATALLLAACGTDRAGGGAVVPPPRCLPPDGVPAAPVTIAEVVTLVNSLPGPLTVDCFLETLKRPLYANATVSVFSLQPAVGRRSPRIFLFFDPATGPLDPATGPLGPASVPLVMSIVPDGRGMQLVEFGQMISDTRSLKGELAFPIFGEVAAATPFVKVSDDRPDAPGTTCRGCHGDESRFDGIDYAEAFASTAIRPSPRNQVTVEALLWERRNCDPAVERDRCRFLGSLFDHGPVVPREFPESLPTFTN